MIRALTIIIALILLGITVELIRREKFDFKYAVGWMAVSLLGIAVTVFDQILFDIARFFGFELASNFIFFSLLCVFVFLGLVMTVFLCQQNNRNDTMAQKIGKLEFEIEELKRKNETTLEKQNT